MSGKKLNTKNLKWNIQFKFVVIVLTVIDAGGCGPITWGVPVSTPSTSAAVPSGVRLVSGIFSTLNGQSLTGIASVYGVDGSSQFTARIENLSGLSENGVQIVVMANSKEVFRGYLKSNKGSSNYSLTLSGQNASDVSWESITLHSTLKGLDYAVALLR